MKLAAYIARLFHKRCHNHRTVDHNHHDNHDNYFYLDSHIYCYDNNYNDTA